MPKTYVTFGQDHRHIINGQVFDKDCVAVFQANSWSDGRHQAFNTFGPKFCFEYYDKPPPMHYFWRGFVEVKVNLIKRK